MAALISFMASRTLASGSMSVTSVWMIWYPKLHSAQVLLSHQLQLYNVAHSECHTIY